MRTWGHRADPGLFDNRSVVLATDFPSARLLASKGIGSAVLLTGSPTHLQEDLEQVLRAWQREGLPLFVQRRGDPAPPEPLLLPRPALLSGLWFRLAVWFGLRRNPAGGFGDFVPFPSAG